MFDKRQDSMYDLHGLSEEQAKAWVVQAIRQASADHVKKIRFITGRGKHVNSKGERGTLFKKLPEWIKEFDYAELAEINPDLGLYDVNIKSSKLTLSKEEKELKAMLADSDKKIGETIEFTKVLAAFGMPFAQYIYAGYLEKGNTDAKVEKNPKLAAEFMKKAADAKFPSAIHEYARYCLHGIGVQQSDEQAVEWLWKGHEVGVIESTESLARAYANAFYGLKFNFQKAFDLHTIAAKAGRTESMRFFGSIYLNGNGVQKDEKLAVEWYEKAAKGGDAKAQYNMGAFYTNGTYVKPDKEKAEYYFKLSADNGDPDAQFTIGRILLSKGETFKPLAFKYLMEAAENGSEAANEFFGNTCKGEEARMWLQRSAQAGNLQSQLKLDKLNGVDRKLEDIPLKEILEKFRSTGINELGLMSEYPRFQLLDIILLRGKARDRKKAFSLIEDYLNQDNAGVLRRLIYYYERGEGLFKIKKTPEKVRELLLKAVEEKDPVSMVKLAILIESEADNPDRFKQAYALLERARKLHYPAAYYFSGVYFEKGLAGKQDNKLALACYQKAVELEKTEGHLEKFVFGPLDQYESIIEKATAGIERLRPFLKANEAPNKTYLGMKPGFWATKKEDSAPEGERKTAQSTEVSRNNTVIGAQPPANLSSGPTAIHQEERVEANQAADEPVYDIANYVLQTVSSFVSKFF